MAGRLGLSEVGTLHSGKRGVLARIRTGRSMLASAKFATGYLDFADVISKTEKPNKKVRGLDESFILCR